MTSPPLSSENAAMDASLSKNLVAIKQEFSLITKTQALIAAVERLKTHEYVTVDTEFMRENTYYPKLCLIQVASEEETILIDPLSPDLELATFFALMADLNVVKIFHSARQDIEIMWYLGKIIPQPLVDTQVMAMVCGYGDQVSYENLAASVANVKIDKSSRFTDWSRRPLTEAQGRYAAADVKHLLVVYRKLRDRMISSGREAWLNEEMAVLLNAATYETQPQDAWRRIKARLRKPIDRAILIELAAWREKEAKMRDVPRGRVLKDEVLIEIAMAHPKNTVDLAHLRAVPQGFEKSRAGGEILEAVARARIRDLATLPPAEEEKQGGNGAILQLLRVLLQATAEQHQVAPRLIATAEQMDHFSTHAEEGHILCQGWRGDVFGRAALQLMRGEMALGFEKGRISVVKR